MLPKEKGPPRRKGQIRYWKKKQGINQLKANGFYFVMQYIRFNTWNQNWKKQIKSSQVFLHINTYEDLIYFSKTELIQDYSLK